MMLISPAGGLHERDTLHDVARVAGAGYRLTPYAQHNGRMGFNFDRYEVTGTLGGFWLRANQLTFAHVAHGEWELSWRVMCDLQKGRYMVEKDGRLTGVVNGHKVTGATVADLLFNAADVLADDFTKNMS